ncbi:MAG: hypothetical protein AB1426_00300 [Bacillota bacterium]
MRQNGAKYPRIVWLLLFLIPPATLFPYLALHYSAPPGTEFTGFFFASDDPESYLTDMRLAEYGWKWNFMFTTEETTGGYIFLYYIILGRLALLLNLPLIVMYHLARIVSGTALILAAWLCLRTLPLTDRDRQWGLVLFCLAMQFPPFYDKYWGLLLISHPEIYPAANILLFPHTAFSQAMFLLAVYFFREWVCEKKTARVLKGNVVLLGLTIVHPYMLLPYFLIILITFCFHYRRFPLTEAAKISAFFVLSIPYLVYLSFLMTRPDMRQWQIQSPTVLTSPWEIVTHDGILLALGVAGLFLLLRREGWKSEHLWLYTVPFLLALLPFPFQERLLEGAGPGLCFAGGAAISSVISRCKSKLAGPFTTGLLLIPLISVLFAPVINPAPRAFMSEEEVSVHRWIDARLDQYNVILSDIPYSLRIPARAGCRVWCGHHDQTLRAKEKAAVLRKFFSSKTFDRDAFLRNNRIDYVLWDTARYPLYLTSSLVPVKLSGKLVLLRNRNAGDFTDSRFINPRQGRRG